MHDLRSTQFLAIIAAATKTILDPIAEQECPLCGSSGWESQRKFVTHVGRHMEEIALSALPREVESDSDFTDSGSEIELNQSGRTTFLEENLRDKPDLKRHGDILNHTAAFNAAAHGNLETFQSLVREDPKLIFVRNRDGATLMDVLAAGGYTDFGRYLLSLGFDVEQPALAAASPLHTAVARGHTKFCELLLDADVDAGYVLVGPNGTGYTAAMAAYHKSCEAVDPKVKEEFYSLALRIAEAEGPPYNSREWIKHQRGEADGSFAGQAPSNIRGLEPRELKAHERKWHPVSENTAQSSTVQMLHDRDIVSSPKLRRGYESEDIKWLPDVQEQYDQFLGDERNYVTEGVWDRFPPGSRLFVGTKFSIRNVDSAVRQLMNLQAIYPLKR
jgi:hypothetical protein